MNTEYATSELNFASSTDSTADTDAELHALIPSLSLAHLLQQRAAILERLNNAIALIREADQMADAAHLGRPRIETNHLARHSTPITGGDAETLEGAYFSVRRFRKGSGHLTFKRADLVDELNRILARHFLNALAAPRQLTRPLRSRTCAAGVFLILKCPQRQRGTRLF